MTVVHTDASVSLLGYNQWRRSLVALPIGTIVEWVEGYSGLSRTTTIKAGQRFKIIDVRDSYTGKAEIPADMVYEMVLVSKTGKEFQKRANWYVDSIARELHHGGCKLVEA